MILAGVDLAWKSEKNTSAIALGQLKGNTLEVLTVEPAVLGIEEVRERLLSDTELEGVAIDAPLIIENSAGQRECERELSKEYSPKYAGCHPSNKTLYPAAASVELSKALKSEGFSHMRGAKWQLECYPHPALIELFGLAERLKYKKGRVGDKRTGQQRLASLLRGLEGGRGLKLVIDEACSRVLSRAEIASLRGKKLKQNEDALDSIVCLYVAGLRAAGCEGRTFGSVERGYIWVPRPH